MSPKPRRSPVSHRERIAALLQQADLPLTENGPAFELLAQESEILHLNKRRSIASGQGSGAVWVIGTGTARTVRPLAERMMSLGYYGRGEIVGIRALATEGGTEELIALEDMEIIRVPVEAMRRVSLMEPEMALHLLKIMAERRLETEKRLEAFLTSTVESRVATFIARLARDHGTPHSDGTLLDLRLTHHDIADYVGATRETVTVVLASLRKKGAIDFERRKIVVKNNDLLLTLS